MQIGQGTYEPKNLVTDDKLEVLVRRTVMLEPIINKSQLVISHCGAGIVLECLRSTMNADKEVLKLGEGTMNISVVNDSLMNNHQFELADKLNEDGYNICSYPDQVLDDLEKLISEGREFKVFPEAKTGLVLNELDDMLLS